MNQVYNPWAFGYRGFFQGGFATREAAFAALDAHSTVGKAHGSADGTCLDDPTYRDIYNCEDWTGYSCGQGGWGVVGSERIERLLSACPVACADVTC
jgi:hypothetical protein